MYSILLEDGNVIDGVQSQKMKNTDLLTKGDSIEKVGKGSPTEAETINVSGMTVMPGLIDAHLHLGFPAVLAAGSSPSRRSINRFTASTSNYVLGAYVNGLKCLEAGYTAVRECGSKGDSVIALRDAVNAGHVDGPRIVAGGTVTSTMGHFDENWPVTLPRPHAKYVADGETEIRKTIRERVREQVDFIKTSTSDSWSTTRSRSWWRNYSPGEMEALVEEAHAWDKPVSVHAYDARPSIEIAVKAGVDNIDHGIYLDEEIVGLMKEKKTTLVPTLSVIKKIYLQRERARDTNPYRVANIVEIAEDVWETHKRSVKMAYEAGIMVGSGTDATGAYGLHGNYAHELEMLHEAGLKPMEAIQAATRVNSQILGMEDRIGTLENGKLADVIVVDGDPLKDLTVLQDKSRVKLVIQGGVIKVNRMNEE